ncbi:MAG: hypothetical protein LC769_04670, partial [Chloroflexi bacterium]|nr:hypothetical protein [Chloroflexota bacterium]
PLDMGIGLLAALVAHEKFRGRGLVRTLLIIPWMLPPIVNGFMWGWGYGIVSVGDCHQADFAK